MLIPDSPAPSIESMIPGTGELRATFKTSAGDIVVKLYENECPRTVANFVALADKYVALGKLYEAPKLLRDMAAGGKKFFG